MKIHRIIGNTLRHLYLFKHSVNRFADAFYWPTIDLLLWGLTITYAKTYAPNPKNIVLMVISGILLWLIVWRGQYEISVNLLEELWNRNLINMFVSPLKLSEWVISAIILGLIKALISIAFASLVAFLLYQVKIFIYGWYLLPFIFLLLMTGWWVGFMVAGIILRYGTKLEQFAWSMIYLISPFSGIYYPISVLPVWAQNIALFIPTSYVFEGAREVIYKGTLDPNKILISFILNFIYLVLSLMFLRNSFDYVLAKKGLVKLK